MKKDKSNCSNRCKKCFYGAAAYSRTTTCDFYLMTGERRGCPAGDDCKRFKENNLSDEQFATMKADLNESIGNFWQNPDL